MQVGADQVLGEGLAKVKRRPVYGRQVVLEGSARHGSLFRDCKPTTAAINSPSLSLDPPMNLGC